MWLRLHKILNDDRRITSFDFIRSVAVITIIFTHFEILDFHGVGVDAFFVLSGFLISKMLSKDSLDVNKQYFVSRSTKIFPSYFFFLLVAMFTGSFYFMEIFGENLPKISEWPQYVFFYRNYAGLPNRWAFEHLWALCVEEQFYLLIFAFSLVCISRNTFRNRIPLLGWSLIMIGVVSKSQALFTDFAEYPTYTHNRLDAFGYGILLFVFHDQLMNLKWLNLKGLLLIPLAALGAVIFFDTTAHQLILRTLAPPLLTLLIILIFDIPFPKIFRIIAYYSYNAYLWHFFVLIPIVHYFGYSALGFSVYLGSTILLAFVSTHLVEDFFINRRKQIFGFIFGQPQILNN